ncbi:hypothetical protein [Streptomyces sp. NPDC050504]|uniref:hypothetical protein n=1 Tax=Streptomyces sp. NPDC050504 TaxID=3365618 RepID=UPI0037A9D333
MDDLFAPVYGDVPEDPRKPLITRPEALKAVRLLHLLHDGYATVSDRQAAGWLAASLGMRLAT